MSAPASVMATPLALYRKGQTVRVKTAQVYTHIRTPWYIMGKVGVIERVVGPFPDAEKVAYGDGTAPIIVLYRVTFFLRDVWDDPAIDADDTIDIEIYEHWLSPA